MVACSASREQPPGARARAVRSGTARPMLLMASDIVDRPHELVHLCALRDEGQPSLRRRARQERPTVLIQRRYPVWRLATQKEGSERGVLAPESAPCRRRGPS